MNVRQKGHDATTDVALATVLGWIRKDLYFIEGFLSAHEFSGPCINKVANISRLIKDIELEYGDAAPTAAESRDERCNLCGEELGCAYYSIDRRNVCCTCHEKDQEDAAHPEPETWNYEVQSTHPAPGGPRNVPRLRRSTS